MTTAITRAGIDQIFDAFQDKQFHQAYRRENGESFSLEYAFEDGERPAEFRDTLFGDLSSVVSDARAGGDGAVAAAIDGFVHQQFLVRFDGMFSRDPNQAEQDEQLTQLADTLKGAYGVQ